MPTEKRSVRHGCLSCLFLSLVAVWATGLAAAQDLIWTEADWSGANYADVSLIDPEIHPGLLVLEDLPEDMRFVGEPTLLQGIYAMEAYHDTLFFGACYHPLWIEGADVMTYDYLTREFSLSYQPYEEGILVLKAIGDTLYMPGPDPRDPHTDPGSIYFYDGHEWTERQTVPQAVHVFDLEVLDDRVYVTDGSVSADGTVWVSDDWGETWTNIRRHYYEVDGEVRRFFGAGVHNGLVYFQPDGWQPQGGKVYTYDGAVWDSVAIPLMPIENQGLFTSWGDSLIYTTHNRMYFLYDDTLIEDFLPFSGDEWCRDVHIHDGWLYGGSLGTMLYRWRPETGWLSLNEVGLSPETEEIQVFATYYGRLYAATSCTDHEGHGGRLYVSAVPPLGSLVSQPHDFEVSVGGGTLTWDAHAPSVASTARLQLRSADTLAELETEPFTGPDGSEASHFTVPGEAIPPYHRGHRWFQYRVEMTSADGMEMPMMRSVTLVVREQVPSAAETGDPAPVALLQLGRPFPNPATDRLRLRIDAPVSGDARQLHLQVVDPAGRLWVQKRLEVGSSGVLTWEWDLRDARGERLPSGIYHIRACDAEGRATEDSGRSVLIAR